MESLWQKLNNLGSVNTNEVIASRLADVRRRFSQPQDSEKQVTSPQYGSFINPNTDRGALLLAAKWFVDRAKKVESVKQIALIGSICTGKQNPKDIDILLTIAANTDIAPIARLSRQMLGRIQRGLLGADVFLVEEGRYLGRPCRYREPHPRVVCAHDNLRCSLDRAFLCDTSMAFKLKGKLLASPPIILYPEFQAKVVVPADVRANFGLSDD
jgi:predicted nucleotidyltransferase